MESSAETSESTPLHRPAARVLLLDDHDRLLLFRVEGGGKRPRPLWITPGGGCKDGETFEQAAERELWEETGARAPAGSCVWLRRHVFEFNGVWLDEVERFYVVRLETSVEISTTNFEDHEHAFMPEHRWWLADEIAGSDAWFAPRNLVLLLPQIIAGAYPPEPFDCGV